MKNRISFLLGLSLLLIASSAHGQPFPQTWVSGVGDDSFPCSRTAPCRTFAFTISVTSSGGEISVLDPGDFRAFPPPTFSPFTIRKSITINGNSIGEIIPVDGENGVTVNVGPTDVVILRGLSINGVRNHADPETGGLNGIEYQAGGKLVLDHCSIYGFKENGIHLANTTTTDTLVQVTNSSIVGNTAYGVHAEGKGTISIANSLLANNGVGVQAETNAIVRLSNNDIFDNPTIIGCGVC